MATRNLHKQLEEMGFTLIRQNRHKIYKHENGGVMSVSCSPKKMDHKTFEKVVLRRAKKIAKI